MNESVAITGIAFELPGIRSWRDLIASLADKDTYIGELPSLRLQDIQNRYGAIEMAKGGFLPLIDQFDNKYFNVSVREAVKMPPEHRLFLMYALRALYDAGYSEEDVRGSNTGIFYTTARSAYSNYLDEGLSEFDSLYGIEGTRLANFLDLRGPVLSVNTTCSSSLVAVNNAVLSLSAGECDMALVGGVKIATMTKDMADRSTVVSRKQHCKPFDEEADGLMNGEGVICIVLKRLKDAERDGDPVYGVIRGSAVNHGGARISSLTAPSAEAQKEVIVKAWKNAGIRPDEIRFIEAHGTGTILGDPIEFAGIKEAFLEYKLADAPCSISSFKGQVGHLDTLSGLAGLVRLVAAVNAGTLPLQANFDRLNKHINDSDCGIKVQTAAETWEAKGGERIGGVSSFGLTGTNIHMIVSQKEGAAERHQDKDWFYLQIGEDDEERLSRLKQQLQEQLSDLEAAQLGSFCEKINRVFQLKNRSQGFVFSTIDALRQQLKAQPEAIQQPMFYILDLELL
ncbi:MAG TPA: polyketide synthase, partial [Chitinophaga sp.]